MRVLELAGGQVGRAYLAPDFVLGMGLVTRDDLVEVVYGVGQSALLARYTTELVVRVHLIRVYLYGALETLAGFVQLAALLVNQPQIVVRRSVRGVQCGSFQILPE